MDYQALQYTLAALYTALAEATALATGKPVEQLSDYFLAQMANSNAPAQAREMLQRLVHDTPEQSHQTEPAE